MHKKGIDAYTLAWKVGVTEKTVVRWRNGKAIPKTKNLKNMSDILECRMDDLIVEDVKARDITDDG